jgi:hypothetical protein
MPLRLILLNYIIRIIFGRDKNYEELLIWHCVQYFVNFSFCWAKYLSKHRIEKLLTSVFALI